MAKDKTPVTPATRFLQKHRVDYSAHLYSYEDKGGTAVSARELSVDEHQVIKTLVMEDESRRPLIILMHGDCEVSTKELARTINVKTVRSCDPATALKTTGYQVGGTSPFATRKELPIYLEGSIIDLPRLFINGGKRGFLVSMKPSVLVELLEPVIVSAGIRK